MANKLPLKDILGAIDLGAHSVWKELSEEERKQVSFWTLNRYASSIRGSRDDVELAVFKTNEYYNKNWNVLGSRHPQLQWQLLCVSGNTGVIKRHEYIPLKKKGADGDKKVIKFLSELYPNMKQDEVELLARLSTTKEIRELAQELGYEKKQYPV